MKKIGGKKSDLSVLARKDVKINDNKGKHTFMLRLYTQSACV